MLILFIYYYISVQYNIVHGTALGSNVSKPSMLLLFWILRFRSPLFFLTISIFNPKVKIIFKITQIFSFNAVVGSSNNQIFFRFFSQFFQARFFQRISRKVSCRRIFMAFFLGKLMVADGNLRKITNFNATSN